MTINKPNSFSFNDLFLKPIERSKVFKIIIKLKDETASGYDK